MVRSWDIVSEGEGEEGEEMEVEGVVVVVGAAEAPPGMGAPEAVVTGTCESVIVDVRRCRFLFVLTRLFWGLRGRVRGRPGVSLDEDATSGASMRCLEVASSRFTVRLDCGCKARKAKATKFLLKSARIYTCADTTRNCPVPVRVLTELRCFSFGCLLS